jgi:hypothetical protein
MYNDIVCNRKISREIFQIGSNKEDDNKCSTREVQFILIKVCQKAAMGSNGRRHQFFSLHFFKLKMISSFVKFKTNSSFGKWKTTLRFGKWKTTSIFWKMEDYINILENGRRPEYFGKW